MPGWTGTSASTAEWHGSDIAPRLLGRPETQLPFLPTPTVEIEFVMEAPLCRRRAHHTSYPRKGPAIRQSARTRCL